MNTHALRQTDAVRLRERARQILNDADFSAAIEALNVGSLCVEELLQELHIYHAELRLQDEALRESQQCNELALTRFVRLYQELPLPTLLLSAEGMVKDANLAATQQLALDRRLFAHLATDDQRALLLRTIQRVGALGKATCTELALRNARGESRLVDALLIRLPGAPGTSHDVICTLVDQTARIQQQRALEALNAQLEEQALRYRVAADFTPDWTYWLNENEQFRYVSPACERVCGYPPSAFIEDPELLTRLIHPDDRPNYLAHQHGRDDSPSVLLFRLRHRDGGWRWIEHHCHQVQDAAGRLLGHCGSNRDCTAEKQRLLNEMNEREAAQGILRRQLAFQRLIAESSSLFVNSQPGELDAVVNHVIAQIGCYFGIDRCYLFRFEPHGDRMSLTHEWCRTGVQAFIAELQNISIDDLPWWSARTRAGHAFHLPSLEALPPLAEAERREFIRQNIRSFLSVPLIEQGRVFGALGLDAVLANHTWSEQEIMLLSLLAENLSSLLKRQQVEQDLLKSEHRYRKVTAVITDVAYSCVKDGEGAYRIDWMTDSIESLTGYPLDQVIAMGCWRRLVIEEDLEQFEQHISAIQPGQVTSCELRLRHANGTLRWVRATTECDHDHETLPRHRLFGGLTDISEQREYEEQIQYLERFDALTGLPNRALTRERIQQALDRKDSDQRRLAMISIDLDDLKTVNDSLGHHAGDRLLQLTAQRLQTLLRPGDLLGRLSGDNFVLVLHRIRRLETSFEVAERIQQNIQQPVELDGRSISVSCSMGIALYPDDAANGEELLRRADAALHQAKAEGKHQVYCFTPKLHAHLRGHFELEQALRLAIGQRQFLLHYQPRVDMRTGRILSLEALLRWQHPALGLVPPGRFIPIAESTGLIRPIGAQVLALVLDQLQIWRRQGLGMIPVAINLSADELYDAALPARIEAQVAAQGIDPTGLEFEVTETAAMRSIDQAVTILSRLRATGFTISIDDFGTGYASLNHLSRLPVQALKIDRSFLGDLFGTPPRGEQSQTIVKTIVGLAHNLGMEVIAEGVETLEQRDFMLEHDCCVGQGFLFSRPLGAMDIARQLTAGCIAPHQPSDDPPSAPA